jgi:hypothetical protein
MEVLLDGVQGALQHSALLWGQAALTLLRDVLKKPFLYILLGKQSSSIYDSWSKLLEIPLKALKKTKSWKV